MVSNFFPKIADSVPDDSANDNQSDNDLNDYHEDIDQQEEDDNLAENNETQKGPGENQALAETMSNNIPLQRIVVSVKHQKRRSSKVLKQGWMIHYTDRDSSVSKLSLFASSLMFSHTKMILYKSMQHVSHCNISLFMLTREYLHIVCQYMGTCMF